MSLGGIGSSLGNMFDPLDLTGQAGSSVIGNIADPSNFFGMNNNAGFTSGSGATGTQLPTSSSGYPTYSANLPGSFSNAGYDSPSMTGYGYGYYGGSAPIPEGGYYNQMAQAMAGPSYSPVGTSWETLAPGQSWNSPATGAPASSGSSPSGSGSKGTSGSKGSAGAAPNYGGGKGVGTNMGSPTTGTWVNGTGSGATEIGSNGMPIETVGFQGPTGGGGMTGAPAIPTGSYGASVFSPTAIGMPPGYGGTGSSTVPSMGLYGPSGYGAPGPYTQAPQPGQPLRDLGTGLYGQSTYPSTGVRAAPTGNFNPITRSPTTGSPTTGYNPTLQSRLGGKIPILF